MGKKKKTQKQPFQEDREQAEKRNQVENVGEETNQIPLIPKDGAEEEPHERVHGHHGKVKHHKQEKHLESISPKQLQIFPKQQRNQRHFTWEEVGKHDRKDDVWVVIDDNVYNLTKMVDTHPGGAEVIMQRAGKLANKAFNKGNHPYHVLEHTLPKKKIGRILHDSQIESWQRERKTGRMDCFCVVLLGLSLLSSLVYLSL